MFEKHSTASFRSVDVDRDLINYSVKVLSPHHCMTTRQIVFQSGDGTNIFVQSVMKFNIREQFDGEC